MHFLFIQLQVGSLELVIRFSFFEAHLMSAHDNVPKTFLDSLRVFCFERKKNTIPSFSWTSRTFASHETKQNIYGKIEPVREKIGNSFQLTFFPFRGLQPRIDSIIENICLGGKIMTKSFYGISFRKWPNNIDKCENCSFLSIFVSLYLCLFGLISAKTKNACSAKITWIFTLLLDVGSMALHNFHIHHQNKTLLLLFYK